MHETDAEERLEKMQEIYSYIKDETPTANESIITILGKNFHDEDIISNYLAYILDPYLNGIGHQPLQHFLELLETPHEPADLEHVDIQREYLLPNQRRIDFLITLNNGHVIAIEHKVFSGEHGNQTVNYEAELRKLYHSINNQKDKTDLTFVFLTPHGNSPLNCNFIPISYFQLVEVLRRIPVDFTKDVRKAVLFHEFISHLEGYFLNNQKLELSKKTSLYMDYLNTIKDLEYQFENDYKNIFRFIQSTIENYFVANVEGQWEFDFSENRSYHKINKPSWKSKDLDIHFEISLSRDSLAQAQLTFRLDIEGSDKKVFEDKQGRHIEKELRDNPITQGIPSKISYGGKWKTNLAFAKKTYHILSPEYLNNEDKLKISLEEIVKEFQPLVQQVDKEIETYSSHQDQTKE